MSLLVLFALGCGGNGEVREDLDALMARVVVLEDELDEPSTALVDLQSDVMTLGSDVDTMQTGMSTVQSDLGDMAARLGALEAGGVGALYFPGGALGFDPDNPVTEPSSRGIEWSASFAGSAYLMLPAPVDYAGGDVTAEIVFYTSTDTDGIVEFFARPTSFTEGDQWSDTSSLSEGGVAVTTIREIGVQTIVFPADRMQEPLWSVNLQRGGAGETYPDPVYFTGLRLTYDAL